MTFLMGTNYVAWLFQFSFFDLSKLRCLEILKIRVKFWTDPIKLSKNENLQGPLVTIVAALIESGLFSLDKSLKYVWVYVHSFRIIIYWF